MRSRALRQHQRNLAHDTVVQLLADAAYRQSGHPEREEFVGRFEDHLEVATFLESWWPQLDPREVLLWLADEERLARYAKGLLDDEERAQLLASMRLALETGVWSVADVALVDDVAARLGPVQDAPREERGFYEIEELDDLSLARRLRAGRPGAPRPGRTRIHPDPPRRARTVAAGADRSPRRTTRTCSSTRRRTSRRCSGGCSAAAAGYASLDVVGDAAQSSWPDAAEAAVGPRGGVRQRSRAGCSTWTRTTATRAEIFDYAAAMIRRSVPDADIPQAVRETGVEPVDGHLGPDVYASVAAAVERLLEEVEGSVAVITPSNHAAVLAPLSAGPDGRLQVTDPMSTKGLEYDATVVVDPDAIIAESPGGARVLYVAMTRAAHRMTVLR